MTATNQYDADWPHPVVSSGVVQIMKAPGINASMFESTHNAKIPPAGSVIYELTCVSGSPASDVSMFSTYQSCDSLFSGIGTVFSVSSPPAWPLREFLFYDAATGRAGMLMVEDKFGTFVAGNILAENGFNGDFYTGSTFYDLSVHAGIIRGRGYAEQQMDTPELRGDIVMARLTDGSLRFRRDSADKVTPVE